MDNNTNVQQEIAQVPLAVFEAEQNRNERREKRHLATTIFLIFALIVTNVAWLWYESQFEVVSYGEITQENVDSHDIENSVNQY